MQETHFSEVYLLGDEKLQRFWDNFMAIARVYLRSEPLEIGRVWCLESHPRTQYKVYNIEMGGDEMRIKSNCDRGRND